MEQQPLIVKETQISKKHFLTSNSSPIDDDDIGAKVESFLAKINLEKFLEWCRSEPKKPVLPKPKNGSVPRASNSFFQFKPYVARYAKEFGIEDHNIQNILSKSQSRLWEMVKKHPERSFFDKLYEEAVEYQKEHNPGYEFHPKRQRSHLKIKSMSKGRVKRKDTNQVTNTNTGLAQVPNIPILDKMITPDFFVSCVEQNDQLLPTEMVPSIQSMDFSSPGTSVGYLPIPEQEESIRYPHTPESELSFGYPHTPESELSFGYPHTPESELSFGYLSISKSGPSIGYLDTPDPGYLTPTSPLDATISEVSTPISPNSPLIIYQNASALDDPLYLNSFQLLLDTPADWDNSFGNNNINLKY